ncbi:MAG: S8 family serine peptidase [Pseudomonadota bacterium]|nr:S8 family serine peptidase [Pseudomonadota bacterium]
MKACFVRLARKLYGLRLPVAAAATISPRGFSAHALAERNVALAVFVCWTLLAAGAPAHAADEAAAVKSGPTLKAAAARDFHGKDLKGKDGPMAKAGMALTELYREHENFRATRPGAVFRSDAGVARIRRDASGADLVTIDAVAAGDARTLRAALEGLGLQNAADYGRVVSGRLPIPAIPAMAALPMVRFARPATATTEAGQTTTQGDIALRSNFVRAERGLDGGGVTVGVISDSCCCFGAVLRDVESGDLPASGVAVVRDACPGFRGEGRAMMQVIHDIAPGAALAFHTGLDGQAAFAVAIQKLAGDPVNAKVIVDDILIFESPFYQDGIIAQALEKAVAGGVAFFSAAGNRARQSYESAFRNSGITGIGGVPHDFDPGAAVDVSQSITIPAGQRVTFGFQWDQPFFSAGGAGSASDLDIYLMTQDGAVLASGLDDNIGGDALETFAYTNETDSPMVADIRIELVAGPPPNLINTMFNPFGALTINEFATNSPSLFGHKNAAGAHTVGAAFYGSTPECGTTPPLLEAFSSSGGVPILFDTSGARLVSPVVRQKPNSVAPDGVNTNFFGDDSFVDPVGACSTTEPFPNFFGTSAAAPHAAAVAALLLDATPSLTPAALYAILENTAINMGPSGFDFETGFGLIQAEAAVASVANAGSVQLSAASYSVSENGGAAIVTVTRTGGSAGAVSVNFATKQDTAVVHVDYRGTNQSVTFGDGDSAGKSISIPILQDTLSEGDERFSVMLSEPTGGAKLGSPGSAIVTISDDDGASMALCCNSSRRFRMSAEEAAIPSSP